MAWAILRSQTIFIWMENRFRSYRVQFIISESFRNTGQDRLEKLKAMGCNTVETYIPWNMHEPKKGEFHFEGMLDIERFVKTAQNLGYM